MPQFLPKDAEKLLAELRDKREAAATETSPGEPVTASPKNVAPPEFTPEKVEKPGKATLEADDADFAKVLASDPYLAAAESDTEHFDNFEDYHFALWVKGLGLDFDGSITPQNRKVILKSWAPMSRVSAWPVPLRPTKPRQVLSGNLYKTCICEVITDKL